MFNVAYNSTGPSMRFIYFLLVGSAAIFAISEGAVPTPSKQLKISSADQNKRQEGEIKKVVAKLIKDKAEFEKLFSAGVLPSHYFDGLKHNDAVKSPLSKVVANAYREGMQDHLYKIPAFKQFAEYSEYYNTKFMAGDRAGELLKTTAKV
ncbi:hypothetical protein PInf_026672 [Phytophthora infestans]|nr:hypothetical protein PInf_026672 [Phytophthora infestans]